MTFKTVAINVTGPSYQSRSRSLSSQRTVNFYQQVSEGGKEKFTLFSFPGQKSINNTLAGIDRNQHRMNEIQYRVVSQKLFQVDRFGNHTEKGVVPGFGRCIFADDGENLVIVSDSVWVYNVVTDVFKENLNVNLENVLSVTFINSQFIYTTADLSFISQPGDPFDVSGLDAIDAESSPDKLVRDYVFNQTIYRFGTRTTEPWYNSGVGNPPIDRIEGQEFSVGLGAIHSLANTDNAIYWLGDDKAIYRVSGGIKERISDDSISNAIEKMSVFSDAFGYALTIQGQDFYLITFPAGSRTYVVSEVLGKNGWFELSSGADGMHYSGTSLVQVYNKNIIAKGGQILELSLDEFTQDTDTMIRERVTQEVNSDLLGVKGRRIKMSRLELIIEQGIGLISGQGENPRMRIETSIDGGRSYKHSAWVRLGRLGEDTLRVELFQILSGKGFIFRFTVSDPVPLSIFSAAIDIKLMGR